MSKFVKLAADSQFPSLSWLIDNAYALFKSNNTILTYMGLGAGIITAVVFRKKFIELIKNSDFQDLVFAALIYARDTQGNPLLKDENGKSLDIKPDQMFKDINYYYQTQGTKVQGKPVGSIAAGAYQSILFPEPRLEILPKNDVVATTFSNLKAITSSSDFLKKSAAEKKQILKNQLNKIIGENKPLFDFIDVNKILP
jgi:hypothetical protein